MGQIRSLASVCVCLSVIAPAVAILNRIWWNFAQLFGVRKLRSSSLGSKSNNAFPYFTQFSPKFTNFNAFSMGRYKHCSIDARWPTVVVNTSHDSPRRALWVITEKWHNPNVPPKLPKIVCNAVTTGIYLSKRWRIISQYWCEIEGWCQLATYRKPPTADLMVTWLIDWLSMVLRLHQHNIGYTADCFYRSVKALKEGG